MENTKIPKIANAVGLIDDDLISSADTVRKKRKMSPAKWAAVAACLALTVTVGAFSLPMLFGEKPVDTDTKYKSVIITPAEKGIVWPWEYMTFAEKYTTLDFDGSEYHGRGRKLSGNLVGEYLGVFGISGSDYYTGSRYTEKAGVYAVGDVSPDLLVAVKADNDFYVYLSDSYSPPARLGGLMRASGLPESIDFSHFGEITDKSGKCFALTETDGIRQLLSGCADAPLYNGSEWDISGRDGLAFTVSSEKLGVYKNVMYITTDGYLMTNIFGYGYAYFIGEDAANKIIGYAKSNSSKSSPEPYESTVIGKIIGITDEYILVDDSILCKNPSDGITYKILLNDIRISRYVDRDLIKVGDSVLVTFDGEPGSSGAISTATGLSEVIISDGSAHIPE